MFWANTSPVPESMTDFGEILPPIVWARVRRRSAAGGPVGAVAGGDVVVGAAVRAAAEGSDRPDEDADVDAIGGAKEWPEPSAEALMESPSTSAAAAPTPIHFARCTLER